MYTNIKYNDYLESMLEQLSGTGAFITAKKNGDEHANTMTIGWGHIGFIWGKPVFIAYVRYNRFTYDIMEHTDEFTISVPIDQNVDDELKFCGINSGRDLNKFEKSTITAIKGRTIDTPIVGECDLHYECKTIYKQAMEPGLIEDNIRNKYYGNNNVYHVIYYGEIVDCYRFNKKL
ncbi:flavin reductase family protein [Haloplasma contractile]|uniref:Arylsulfatase protein n=1 Tax=Haloplasma contractile SSD-17B TaxID=1033810 RepID=U2FKW3_9MOLU|nr:flavin reductase [Haloplasma contractile]ERJ13420.1 arylsulfatase protein [Haloplasma contractile SSD-17B]